MPSLSISSNSLSKHVAGWRQSASGPAYRQLADRLRLLVLDGRLPLGARLPGERELSRALGISRTTTAAAYATLRDNGFLESRRGSGFRTRLPANSFPSASDLSSMPEHVDLIDLSIASLPAGEFIGHAYADALQRLPAYLPSAGYHIAGLDILRSAIALKYERRGLPTTPMQIIVTSGALHGLALLLRTLAGPGDRVVIEHPTFPRAINAIERAFCQPVPVSLPEQGWDVDGFGAAFRQTGPRLAYLIPDFQNPTGRCMDSDARAQLAALALETRTTLIFDETQLELGIDCDAPRPDPAAERNVVRLGSLGKSHWGGLRVGWIRADPDLIQALASARASIDLGTPVLEQIAAAILLEDEDCLKQRRAALGERRDAVLELLGQRLPSWKAPVPAGGVSIWAELPEPMSSALAATAARHGVRIASGPRFGTGTAFERFIRIPFTQSVPTMEIAIDRLAQAFDRIAPAKRQSDRIPLVV